MIKLDFAVVFILTNRPPTTSLYRVKRLYFSDVLWIQYGDEARSSSQDCGGIVIQLHPIKAAMLRVRVNAHHRPVEPAVAAPIFGIQKNLHPVADSDLLCHRVYVRRFAQSMSPIATTIITPPLMAHCGFPVIKLPGNTLIPCRKKIPPARINTMARMFKSVFIPPPKSLRDYTLR